MIHIETLSKYDLLINPDTGRPVFDELTGNPYIMDKVTGEVEEGRTITIGPRDLIITEEQQKQRKAYAETQTRRKLSRALGDELGKFIFVSTNSPFSDLSNETVGRLMYLATYLKIGDGDTYKLYLSERKQMHRKDLCDVMGSLSETTVFRFYKDIVGRILYEDEDGYLSIDGNLFKKGRLSKGNVGNGYEKAYINAVQTLYRATPVKQHGKLGLMFKMLPYLNVEFNVLCWNPKESVLDNVLFLSLADFCKIADCSAHNLRRLMNEYEKITFDVNGKQEQFCSFVLPGGDRDKARIFINPHVLYSGTNYKYVEILGAFCHM